MKRIILILAIISIFSCKNEKKEIIEGTQKDKKEIIVTSVDVPVLFSWSKYRVNFEETEILYHNSKFYSLSRSSINESSFISTPSIYVNDGSFYKTSIIVKKGDEGGLFGLRIQGIYPNRADAIFDLETGKLKGVEKAGNFENPSAVITSLGDGTYKCILKTVVNDTPVRLIFGTTTNRKNILGWEGKTSNSNRLLIVPSSLKLEEVSQ